MSREIFNITLVWRIDENLTDKICQGLEKLDYILLDTLKRDITNTFHSYRIKIEKENAGPLKAFLENHKDKVYADRHLPVFFYENTRRRERHQKQIWEAKERLQKLKTVKPHQLADFELMEKI